MKREIKFKAWDKIEKEIVEINSLDDLYIADSSVFEIEEVCSGYETYMRKKDVTDRYDLMQYTGCKDSKGKEIYEGHIVRYKNKYGLKFISKVKYDRDKMVIANDKSNTWYFIGGMSEDCTIIGNIYKNKKVLEYGLK